MVSRPLRWSLLVMLVYGCSNSNSSSSSCSGTSTCDINPTATMCGDQITLECFGGATPDATGQCQLALEQDTEAIYCCVSAVPPAAAQHGGDAGAGGAGSGGAGGAGGAGGGPTT